MFAVELCEQVDRVPESANGAVVHTQLFGFMLTMYSNSHATQNTPMCAIENRHEFGCSFVRFSFPISVEMQAPRRMSDHINIVRALRAHFCVERVSE